MANDIKGEILDLFKIVEREGIKELVEYLCNKTDFFEAPASTKGHGSYVGGLAEHCLNVYDSLVLLNAEFMDKGNEIPHESIIIVGLLHDLCKVNIYFEDDEMATGPQMKFLGDLLCKTTDPMPPDKQLTKAYVTKLIDYYKNGGTFPEYAPAWKVEEELPLGHGEKSIFLIQKHMDLTEEEAVAIRWHLGSFDPGTLFFYPSGIAIKKAVEKYALVPMLVSADYLATWLVETKR
jgi:hypothetical protein